MMRLLYYNTVFIWYFHRLDIIVSHALLIAAYVVGFTGAFGYVLTDAMLGRYQKGTYQRYVYATLVIIANIITTMGFVLFTVSEVLAGYAWLVVLTVPMGCFTALIAYWTFRNEDNWFNDRWNKLKQAIKKSLQSRHKRSYQCPTSSNNLNTTRPS